MRFVFDVLRTAQAATWLLSRHDGRMTRGQVLKLLYLADRRSLLETGAPITGDYMVSMDQGPVLSITYDLIKGNSGRPDADEVWREHVATDGRQVVAVHGTEETYDRLTRRDLEILQYVDEAFGSMRWSALSAYTHGLPEWENPAGSMRPIAPETILDAEGLDQERVGEVAREAEEDRRLHEMFRVR